MTAEHELSREVFLTKRLTTFYQQKSLDAVVVELAFTCVDGDT